MNEEGGKIGRHSSNKIIVVEESISRYHAEIIYKDNLFYLRDIGSSTGTYLKIVDKLTLK